jgi:hypothetical protein
MSRSVLEQVTRHLDLRDVVEAHGPSEHVEQVGRPGATRVGAVFDQELYDREVASFGSEVNRVCVVAFIANVRVGSA